MLHVSKDPDALLVALADFIVERAKTSIKRSDRFTIALSGGSSPKRLYELLASDAYRLRIDWKKVYFFFGDERYVPADHANSNFLMVKKSLFVPLNIAVENIFGVNTSLQPADAATDYETRIRNHFQGKECRFDLILLGLGDNSHTASLFPHTSVLHEKHALVKEIYVQEVSMYRITFTAPLINAAHCIAFLVYGSSKAEAVANILKGPIKIDDYPAQLINPADGELHWFMDGPAAADVDEGD
ncbi:MAG TPA: 6-phosphogluconolactonase [Chryseolinea sp.]|nr:6-phosphogluconolactonase [Chryseolinea sp.]